MPVTVPVPRLRRQIRSRSAGPDAEFYERSAYPDAYAEAEPLLNGGGASGGASNAKGGNSVKTNTNISKSNLSGGGNVINAGTSNGQSGGNVKGVCR